MGMFDDVLKNVGEPYTGGGKGFEYGTHEVMIGVVDPVKKKTKNNPEAEVIEVEVYDPNDEERTAKATLYFHTEGGAQMSVTKILGILVHNVGEEKKETVRNLGKKLFASITDPTEARDVAAKLMSDKMIGKKAYLVAEPQGKYKTTSYGDIWHYEAEPQGDAPTETVLEEVTKGGEPVPEDEIPEFDDL